MLKYVDAKVVFQEVPDEITLAINISNCPCHCEGCHSSYLAEDIGNSLTMTSLNKLIKDNKGVSCIAFMGGDSNPIDITALACWIKTHTNLKTAWYSGRQELDKAVELYWFDYIKLGPYIERLGPLNSKTTNQRFYRVSDNKLIDVTDRFWKD